MSAPEGYKALGKIGISYKGDYNPNTVYERLDAVYHNGSTYLAIKDAPDGAPRNDKINWIYLAKGYDGETVDVADSEIAFTDSETRENIASGEKVSTVFGKVKKFFTDLTAPAFAQMITTKEDLLATKVTGYVPDAKAVADGFADVNGKLNWFDIKNVYGEYTAVGSNNSAEICRLSLTPGTWLLLGYIDNSMSKDTIYNNSIFRESLSHHCQTVRSTLIGGGGSVNSYAITVQTNIDMILGTYDNSDIKGNIFRGTLYAIRLLKL